MGIYPLRYFFNLVRDLSRQYITVIISYSLYVFQVPTTATSSTIYIHDNIIPAAVAPCAGTHGMTRID